MPNPDDLTLAQKFGALALVFGSGFFLFWAIVMIEYYIVPFVVRLIEWLLLIVGIGLAAIVLKL